MVKHLSKIHSLARIDSETSSDKVFGIVGDWCEFREWVLAAFNFAVGVLDFCTFERRSTKKHGVQNDANGPEIDFVGVTIFAVKNLRRDVVWSTTYSSFALSFKQDTSSKPEISNSNLHPLIKKKVSEFEITMDNALRVEVLNTSDKLENVRLGLKFSYLFSSSY